MTGHRSNQANEGYTHPTGAYTSEASRELYELGPDMEENANLRYADNSAGATIPLLSPHWHSKKPRRLLCIA